MTLAALQCIPTYPIEQFGNRTQLNTNRSIAELNQTHNTILPIEHNRTFDYRTIGNRTQSNVRLPNDWYNRTFASHDRHVVLENSEDESEITTNFFPFLRGFC